MEKVLLASDGSPYEDLITLDPILADNAYLLDGRYYDITSLYGYVTSNTYRCVVPHTRTLLDNEKRSAILGAYNAKHTHRSHQRHHVRKFNKGMTASAVEYIDFDESVPTGTIVYEKNERGEVNKYTTVVPYFKGNLACFVHTREKTIKAVDVIGYSLPGDQIGDV